MWRDEATRGMWRPDEGRSDGATVWRAKGADVFGVEGGEKAKRGGDGGRHSAREGLGQWRTKAGGGVTVEDEGEGDNRVRVEDEGGNEYDG